MAEVASADRGLQPQRTALAWSRTGLAVFVNALIVLRAGLVTDQLFMLALGVFLLVAAGLSVVCGTWRVKHLAADGSRPMVQAPAEFGIFLRNEVAKWERVARAAGLKKN